MKYSAKEKFILKNLRDDFQSISAIYQKEFDEIECIILFESDMKKENKTLQLPVYIWHNSQQPETLEKEIHDFFNHNETVTLEYIKGEIAKRVKDANYIYSSPVTIEEYFDGVLYFKKDKHKEGWSAKQKSFLDAFSSSIALFSMYMENVGYIQNHSWMMNEILNQMNDIIYVTDIENDEILYMNQKMKDALKISDYSNKKCWELLFPEQGGACATCSKRNLLHSTEENPSSVRETYYPKVNKTYENHSSLIRWNDGRIVFFHQSIDVSARKKLYEEATFDELTSAYTRRRGKSKLESTLRKIHINNEFFSIVMVDVNELKSINDTYGHMEGDTLLRSISQEIQNNLQNKDYLCRLSGDEFFIVFMNCTKEDTIIKMNAILENLSNRKLFPQEYRSDEFCYGCVEVHPNDKYEVRSLLTDVDEQLYISKRDFHIRLAEAKLIDELHEDYDISSFTYDSDLLYGALVKSTDDYIYICNMETGVFCYPQAMVDEFDLPGRVIHNAAAVWGQKVHKNDKQIFLEANQVITDGRASHHTVEYRVKNHAGEWVWLRCRGNTMKNNRGETTLFAGIITNMGRKNIVDNNTGLLNKHAFKQKIDQIFEANAKEKFTILLINIDDFKRINSLNDIAFGDGVLKTVAQKIQSLLSPSQSMFRLVGDEFAFIIRNEDKEETEILFQKIQNAFKSIQTYENKNYFITFSGGSATAQEDADNFMDLNKYADYALGEAKQKGKDSYIPFNKNILKVRKRSQEIIEILRVSMENDFKGFSLHYQPIVTSDKKVAAGEALARFHCEEYGDIYPMEFISLLEDNNLIVRFGEWVFEESMKAPCSFIKKFPDFQIGVNLSVRQLEDGDFLPFMKTIIDKYQIPRKNIVLELTESTLANNIRSLSDIVKRIREMGILVVMDDFGTGYSSLGLLKEIPIDILKIDRLFVMGIKENGFDRNFIKLVVEMCKTLNILTLLEGIEEEEEYTIGEKLGLTYFQGYYFGKGVDAKSFEKIYLPE